MKSRLATFAAFCCAVTAALAWSVPDTRAQTSVAVMRPAEAQAQLERAIAASEAAAARAAQYSSEASEASEAADRAASEAAALAASVQAAEADIIAARARFSIARNARLQLDRQLAQRREPLVRLTAALQTNARRPLALSALQPGSLKDVVYVQAVLDSAVPQIRERTAALRGELEQGRQFEREARNALENLRTSEADLKARRAELAQTETRQRLVSREARAIARREEDRAIALGEDARDLDGLIARLDADAALRRDLSALPGPMLRPANLGDGTSGALAASQSTAVVAPVAVSTAAPDTYQLPVQGRTVTGFGEARSSGLRTKGLTLAPRPNAQVVAPSRGRVAFAGEYEGFGRIVIIEHPNGWTSLVTGLGRVDVQVGETVIAGAPLGSAQANAPSVGIELRKQGEPVNPLDYLR